MHGLETIKRLNEAAKSVTTIELKRVLEDTGDEVEMARNAVWLMRRNWQLTDESANMIADLLVSAYGIEE